VDVRGGGGGRLPVKRVVHDPSGGPRAVVKGHRPGTDCRKQSGVRKGVKSNLAIKPPGKPQRHEKGGVRGGGGGGGEGRRENKP